MIESLIKFFHPTLRKKILSTLILILFISSLGNIFAFRTITQVTEELNSVLGKDTPRLNTLFAFENVSKDIESVILNIQLLEPEVGAGEFGKLAQKKFQILADIELLRSLEEQYRSFGDLNKSRSSFLFAIADFRERTLPLALDLIYLKETGVEKGAIADKIEVLQKEVNQLKKNIEEKTRDEQALLSGIQNQIGVQREKVISVGTLIIFVTILIALTLGVILSQVITKSITMLEKAAREIGAGVLGKTVEIKSQDEIGKLAATFNEMSKKLKGAYESLAEAKAKDEALLRSIGEGIIAVDREGKVILINDAGQTMLRIKAGEVLGKDWFDFLRVEDENGNLIPKEKQVFYLALHSGAPNVATYYYVRKDGTKFPVSIKGAPIANEKIEGAVVVFRDLTEEKVLERAKEAFIAITAHELRTPLTVIRGNAELILGSLSKSANREMQSMVEAIERSSKRLLEIINDFLDLTALEEKRIQFKRELVDILGLAKEVMAELRERADEKKLHLILEKPSSAIPKVLGDKDRAKEVLINIVINAIQYTDKGGVTVKGEVAGKFLKILVTDTGIGIQPELQGALFQRFQTVGGRFIRSHEYGSGMGLYITKLLVEGMGGSVKLERSEPGVGSTFSLSLPIAN